MAKKKVKKAIDSEKFITENVIELKGFWKPMPETFAIPKKKTLSTLTLPGNFGERMRDYAEVTSTHQDFISLNMRILSEKAIVRQKSIRSLELASFKNGVIQGKIFACQYDDLSRIYHRQEKALKRSFNAFCTESGHTVQKAQLKIARFRIVQSIPEKSRRDAMKQLHGTIIDIVGNLPSAKYGMFLKLLEDKAEVLQSDDIMKIRKGLNDFSATWLGIKKQPVQGRTRVQKDVLGRENDPDTEVPQEIHANIPTFDKLESCEQTQGEFLAIMQDVRRMIVPFQTDPAMYFDRNVLEFMQGFITDCQKLTDRLRLDLSDMRKTA